MGIVEDHLTRARLSKATLTTADFGGAGEAPLSVASAKGPCPDCGKAGGHRGRCPIGAVRKSAAVAESMAKAADKTPEPFSSSKDSNWVAKQGGLPNYIQHVAHALVEQGKTTSRAIAMAIGIVRNWAEGKGGVSADTKAAATKAIAQWESMRAKARAS